MQLEIRRIQLWGGVGGGVSLVFISDVKKGQRKS